MPDNQLPATLKELLEQLNKQEIYDYRRYKAIRKYLCFKAREKNHPISGSFELTPLCNLDCKMCYVHLQNDQLHGQKLLTVEQWKDIMRQAIDGGMMYASLTGGECLTYPGFRELYLFLQERGIEVNILSNGALMDAETAAFLQENPPALVQITLYGASDAAYERVTGKPAFKTVWTNVLRLRQLGIPVLIAVTPNAFMQDGEEIVRLLHEEDLPISINAGLLSPREETGRELAEADPDVYIAMQRLNAYLRGSISEPECLNDDAPEPNTNSAGGEAPRGVRCGAGRSAFAVDWHGGMRPCNNFPCDSVDVMELGFAEAWRRSNRTAREFPRPVECEDCAYSAVCKNCVAEHSAGAPVGHASPAICAWARKMVAAGLLKIQQ